MRSIQLVVQAVPFCDTNPKVILFRSWFYFNWNQITYIFINIHIRCTQRLIKLGWYKTLVILLIGHFNRFCDQISSGLFTVFRFSVHLLKIDMNNLDRLLHRRYRVTLNLLIKGKWPVWLKQGIHWIKVAIYLTVIQKCCLAVIASPLQWTRWRLACSPSLAPLLGGCDSYLCECPQSGDLIHYVIPHQSRKHFLSSASYCAPEVKSHDEIAGSYWMIYWGTTCNFELAICSKIKPVWFHCKPSQARNSAPGRPACNDAQHLIYCGGATSGRPAAPAFTNLSQACCHPKLCHWIPDLSVTSFWLRVTINLSFSGL
jgi:hypothetical protein